MDCFGTYFTHVQTCNLTRVKNRWKPVQSHWANSRSAVTGKGMKKSGAWKTGGLSSHRCWPQNTVRVVNHTEKNKKTKKSMIPISGSKWWFCHSEIKDYMFSWDGKKSGGLFMPPGRKPYPRNTFFWASSCSSLCFDPGVMSILTASVHTSHMLAPWKRSCSKCYAMHWMSLHTSHMLVPWKHSCSKCYGMDCLGTYFTHAQT